MPIERFMTLEGIDGAGKSTHLAFVANYLSQKGREVTLTREPGGTALGEKLRKILLDATIPLTLDAQTLLMFAARAEHLETVIQPALDRGNWVLSDRFTDATFAYQGGGYQVALNRIKTLMHWVQQDFKPHLTLLVDTPAEIALQRLSNQRFLDRFEKEALNFHQRVRQTYLDLAEQEPQRFIILDGSRTIAQIQEAMAKQLEARLPQP